jgi:DNA-binding ferritin-like protein
MTHALPEHMQITVPRDGSPRDASAEAARLLTERLADCIDLRALVRQATRQLSGISSRRLREGLNEVEADLGDYVGLLGERAVQLDGWPRRTGAEPEPWPGAEPGASLPGAVAAFSRRARGAVEDMDRLGDGDSAAILAEVARVADTWLWCLDAPPPAGRAGASLRAREPRRRLQRR